MQVPLWLFLLSLLVVFTGREIMNSLSLAVRGGRVNPGWILGLKTAATGSAGGMGRSIYTTPPSSPFSHTTSTSHQQPFSTSTSISQQLKQDTKNQSKMADQLLPILQARRTYYALSASSPIPDSRITSLVQDILKHTPSSFNSQSTRIVVLFKEEHVKFWNMVKSVIKSKVSAEQWAFSEKKLEGFEHGYGTVLFFDDQTTVQSFSEKFALYADKFPVWATQSNAMTQYAIWLALEAEGLGANLQHYNPIIDEEVQKLWGVSKEWKLNAQLVFGKREAEAGEKTFLPLEGEEGRVKVFGA